MIEELYINDLYIELAKDTVIGMTYQANDLGDIGKGKGNYSNIFRVPKTKNNQGALGVSSDINAGTVMPYNRNAARYLQNGIDIIQNGSATVLAFDTYYEIKVVAGNIAPFELMREKSIRELKVGVNNDPFYFSDNYFDTGNVGFIGVGVTTYNIGDEILITQDAGYVNESYNTNTIITNIIPNAGNNIIITEIPWALPTPPNPGQINLYDTIDSITWTLEGVIAANSRTDGVLFPIINHNGMSGTLRQVDVRRLMPAVYAKTLLQAAFQDIGFTYSGNFLTGKFNDLALPLVSAESTAGYVMRIDSGYNQTGTGVLHLLNTKTLDKYNNWTYGDGLFASTPNDSRAFLIQDIWKFTADNAHIHKFTLSLTYTSTGVGDMHVRIGYKRKTAIIFGGTFYGMGEVIASRTIAGGTSATVVIEGSTKPNIGDEIFVAVYGGTSGTVTYTTATYLEVEIQKTAGQASFNGQYPVAQNLPDINQAEFVKTIAQLYGLVYQTNNYTKNVNFYSYEDVEKNKAIAIDWSSKLDVSKNVAISYTIGDYAQTNQVSYRKDNSVNSGVLLYTGNIYVNNKSLPVTKKLIELPFAETEMQEKLNGLDVPYINKFDVISDTFTLDAQPRLLYIDKQTVTPGIEYQDGISTPQTETADIPLCYFVLDGEESLGFSENLLENNYKALQNILTNVKRINAHFKLNVIDIQTIDHSIPIRLDVQMPNIRIAGFFYLNKVEDYVAEKVTKVELIKI